MTVLGHVRTVNRIRNCLIGCDDLNSNTGNRRNFTNPELVFHHFYFVLILFCHYADSSSLRRSFYSTIVHHFYNTISYKKDWHFDAIMRRTTSTSILYRLQLALVLEDYEPPALRVQGFVSRKKGARSMVEEKKEDGTGRSIVSVATVAFYLERALCGNSKGLTLHQTCTNNY